MKFLTKVILTAIDLFTRIMLVVIGVTYLARNGIEGILLYFFILLGIFWAMWLPQYIYFKEEGIYITSKKASDILARIKILENGGK